MKTILTLMALFVIVGSMGLCGCIDIDIDQQPQELSNNSFVNTLKVTDGIITENGSRYIAPLLKDCVYDVWITGEQGGANTTATAFYDGLGYDINQYKSMPNDTCVTYGKEADGYISYSIPKE